MSRSRGKGNWDIAMYLSPVRRRYRHGTATVPPVLPIAPLMTDNAVVMKPEYITRGEVLLQYFSAIEELDHDDRRQGAAQRERLELGPGQDLREGASS